MAMAAPAVTSTPKAQAAVLLEQYSASLQQAHAAVAQRDALIANLQRMLGVDKAVGVRAQVLRCSTMAALHQWRHAVSTRENIAPKPRKRTRKKIPRR